MKQHRYPSLVAAAIEMARYNGGINRCRTERQFLNDLSRVLEHSPHNIAAIDAWLATKNSDEILMIVDGERNEMPAAIVDAPPGTDMLLEDIFDRAV
jgi:hypothetical protein